MSPAHIRLRKTKSGERRYDVRYRRGGRGYPIEHAGTFRTQAEARARRDMIAGELAAGRDPRVLLANLATPQAPPVTLAVAARTWLESRVDVRDSTRSAYGDHVRRITTDLGDRAPDSLTPADVRAWIAQLSETLAASSTKNYVGTLRQILDDAGVYPNPARDRTVRLPKVDREEITPPSAAHVATILRLIPKRWRLPLLVLEQTGMRVGEAERLQWQDVDVQGSRLRIRQGKSRAARRWVTVPDWLMADLDASCPIDDRTAERYVFPGFTRGAARNAMARVCKAAGIPHYHPHDLRHRYASVQIARGVPVARVAEQIGHEKKSLTLDTYTHVLLAEEDA